MLGKILGGIAGARAAGHIRGVDKPGGALLGIGAAALARRFGPLGMIAALAGGYAYKRYNEKRDTRAKARPKVRPSAT